MRTGGRAGGAWRARGAAGRARRGHESRPCDTADGPTTTAPDDRSAVPARRPRYRPGVRGRGAPPRGAPRPGHTPRLTELMLKSGIRSAGIAARVK